MPKKTTPPKQKPAAKQQASGGRRPSPCCASSSDNADCCAKSAKNARQTHYTFRNRDGQTIQLRGDLTMEDLIRMGYTDIRLVQPEKPLAPHEWRADPLHAATHAPGANETPLK